MNSKIKIIAAVVLVFAGVGVWVPQFVWTADPKAGKVLGEIPADGVMEQQPSPVAAGFVAEPTRAAKTAPTASKPNANVSRVLSPEETSTATTNDRLGDLRDLEGVLGSMESFLPYAGAPDRGSLLELLDSVDASSMATNEEGVDSRPAPSLVDLEGFDGSTPADFLATFAEENACQGIIYGDDRSIALLGHRVVREGDRLAGGRVLVEAIGPGWLRLACHEAEIVIDLPPFRAQPRTTSGGEVPEEPPAEAGGDVTGPIGNDRGA